MPLFLCQILFFVTLEPAKRTIVLVYPWLGEGSKGEGRGSSQTRPYNPRPPGFRAAAWSPWNVK